MVLYKTRFTFFHLHHHFVVVTFYQRRLKIRAGKVKSWTRRKKSADCLWGNQRLSYIEGADRHLFPRLKKGFLSTN